jgi:hypothetical protein
MGIGPICKPLRMKFGDDLDFAQLQKIYGDPQENEKRYSQPFVTSFVERQNWTVRTNMPRYTRLSHGFSRKLENLAAATALKLFRLQLYQDSSDPPHVPCQGRWCYESAVERGRIVFLWEADEQRRAERVG